MDTLLMHNALGVIERLSVKRKAQNAMLQLGVIDWICNTLKDFNSLKTYTLEYLNALLMNLVLRNEGRIQCDKWKTDLLKILKQFLDSENTQITTYVNGTLYSIFGFESIRLEAIVISKNIIENGVCRAPKVT